MTIGEIIETSSNKAMELPMVLFCIAAAEAAAVVAAGAVAAAVVGFCRCWLGIGLCCRGLRCGGPGGCCCANMENET